MIAADLFGYITGPVLGFVMYLAVLLLGMALLHMIGKSN